MRKECKGPCSKQDAFMIHQYFLFLLLSSVNSQNFNELTDISTDKVSFQEIKFIRMNFAKKKVILINIRISDSLLRNIAVFLESEKKFLVVMSTQVKSVLFRIIASLPAFFYCYFVFLILKFAFLLLCFCLTSSQTFNTTFNPLECN